MNYEIVPNPRKRALEYKEGEPMSVGYQFFDEQAYQNAKKWLDRQGVKFTDNGFTESSEFIAHVIVTSYSTKDSNFVFNNIDYAEPTRLCVIGSRMVDLK